MRGRFRTIKMKFHALFRFEGGYFHITHLKYIQVKKSFHISFSRKIPQAMFTLNKQEDINWTLLINTQASFMLGILLWLCFYCARVIDVFYVLYLLFMSVLLLCMFQLVSNNAAQCCLIQSYFY